MDIAIYIIGGIMVIGLIGFFISKKRAKQPKKGAPDDIYPMW